MTEVTTFVLRVEHGVPDYERWKREAFDRDPIGRERSGVRRYRVLRSRDEAGLVAIELEFDSRAEADAFAAALIELWSRVQNSFGWRELPTARVFDLAETGEY